jgi:hypothetical protein
MGTQAQTFLDARPAAMSPIQAPQAANDDVMKPVFEEVERALEQAGLISACV